MFPFMRSASMYPETTLPDGLTDAALLYHLRGELGNDVLVVLASSDPPPAGRAAAVVAVCDSPWSQRRLTGAGASQLDLFVVSYHALEDRGGDMERYPEALAVISTGRLVWDPARIGASLQKRASTRLARPRRKLSEAERCDRVLSCYDALGLARAAAHSGSQLAVPLAQVAAMECFRLLLRDADVWPTDLLAQLDEAMNKRHPVVDAIVALRQPRLQTADMIVRLDVLETMLLGGPSQAVVHCFGSRRLVRSSRRHTTNRRIRADLRA